MYVCIFAGVHHHRKDVKFNPQCTNAVCCDSMHLYIIQFNPPGLSVFDWSATHLCDADNVKLGLSADDYLTGIEITGDYKSFMIAVGDSFNTMRYIHQYKAE